MREQDIAREQKVLTELAQGTVYPPRKGNEDDVAHWELCKWLKSMIR
jgi:hypothetical protein